LVAASVADGVAVTELVALHDPVPVLDGLHSHGSRHAQHTHKAEANRRCDDATCDATCGRSTVCHPTHVALALGDAETLPVALTEPVALIEPVALMEPVTEAVGVTLGVMLPLGVADTDGEGVVLMVTVADGLKLLAVL
jgi:hypothetical protein